MLSECANKYKLNGNEIYLHTIYIPAHHHHHHRRIHCIVSGGQHFALHPTNVLLTLPPANALLPYQSITQPSSCPSAH